MSKLNWTLAIGFCTLLTAIALYFGVIRHQRALYLVALTEVTFSHKLGDGHVIFVLPKGGERKIVGCEDRKSTIEPLIRMDDGQLAYVASGNFGIRLKATGLLSWPEYLGCPKYFDVF
jgi:hypothetical protein